MCRAHRFLSRSAASGFTLLELLIVMSILSLLSVILFRTYTSISQIAVRTKEQQRVLQQVLYVSQVLQNTADQSVLDTGAYGTGTFSASGSVSYLALSGQQGAVRFFASGQCDRALWTGTYHECVLYLRKDNRDIALTIPSFVSFGKFEFVIPLLAGAPEHGFQLRMEAYSPRFGLDRFSAVKLPVQQFFTLP